MREPDWMFASVVVLGFIAIVLACVYESTYDARHYASDDARRAGNGSWYFSCEFVPELIQRWNTRVTATASIDKEVMAGTVQQVMERIPNALKMLEDS